MAESEESKRILVGVIDIIIRVIRGEILKFALRKKVRFKLSVLRTFPKTEEQFLQSR